MRKLTKASIYLTSLLVVWTMSVFISNAANAAQSETNVNRLTELETAEMELKKAQTSKTLAEAKVAQDVTPLLEGIKLFSSLIIGIGGALAAIAGVQFAKAEQKEAKMAVDAASQQIEKTKIEAEKLKVEIEKYKASQQNLNIKNDRIGLVLDESMKIARDLHDDAAKLLFALSTLKDKIGRDEELNEIVENTRQMQLSLVDTIYKANREKIEQLMGKAIPPAKELVNDIFGDSVDTRLSAFELLALFYRNDENIIPIIVSQASQDRKNFNGIYNAFTALSIMQPSALKKHNSIIVPLLAISDQIGPRTQRKAQDILQMLSNDAA